MTKPAIKKIKSILTNIFFWSWSIPLLRLKIWIGGKIESDIPCNRLKAYKYLLSTCFLIWIVRITTYVLPSWFFGGLFVTFFVNATSSYKNRKELKKPGFKNLYSNLRKLNIAPLNEQLNILSKEDLNVVDLKQIPVLNSHILMAHHLHSSYYKDIFLCEKIKKNICRGTNGERVNFENKNRWIEPYPHSAFKTHLDFKESVFNKIASGPCRNLTEITIKLDLEKNKKLIRSILAHKHLIHDQGLANALYNGRVSDDNIDVAIIRFGKKISSDIKHIYDNELECMTILFETPVEKNILKSIDKNFMKLQQNILNKCNKQDKKLVLKNRIIYFIKGLLLRFLSIVNTLENTVKVFGSYEIKHPRKSSLGSQQMNSFFRIVFLTNKEINEINDENDENDENKSGNKNPKTILDLTIVPRSNKIKRILELTENPYTHKNFMKYINKKFSFEKTISSSFFMDNTYLDSMIESNKKIEKEKHENKLNLMDLNVSSKIKTEKEIKPKLFDIRDLS